MSRYRARVDAPAPLAEMAAEVRRERLLQVLSAATFLMRVR